jgi:transmembrane 9 superfamily member 3
MAGAPPSRRVACVAAAALALLAARAPTAAADDETHRYSVSPPEPVVVWVSSVTPYHNPSEVYTLYGDLPICRPPRLEATPAERPPHLGELVLGHALENSDVDVRFRTAIDRASLCRTGALDAESAKLLAYAVSNHYLIAMLVDDLPVYAMLGEIVLDEQAVEDLEAHADTPHGIADNAFVYTHKTFSVAYNGDQIVAVNLTASEPVKIEAGKAYEFTYSVVWVPSSDSFDARFNRYIDQDLRRTQVRWFGVINSALMAVFLCGTVALILLRTLRADFARYLRDEEGEDGGMLDKAMGDETGWKQVSSDVFRRPQSVVLYSALVGVGSHLFLLAMVVIGASLVSSLHVDRGAVVKAGVVTYALTSAASGFFSGAFHRSLYPGETSPQWIRVMLLSAVLFPGLCVGVAVLLSFVALGYGTNSYISLWTIIKLGVLWGIVSVPLTVGGTIAGRRFGSVSSTPFRVNPYARPVPSRPWYLGGTMLCIAAGLLPFGSVFVEVSVSYRPGKGNGAPPIRTARPRPHPLSFSPDTSAFSSPTRAQIYYIATSAWGHAIYAAWALFLVVLVILAMVVSCVSVVSVYLLLNSEGEYGGWVGRAGVLRRAWDPQNLTPHTHTNRPSFPPQTTAGTGTPSSPAPPLACTSSSTPSTSTSSRRR